MAKIEKYITRKITQHSTTQLPSKPSISNPYEQKDKIIGKMICDNEKLCDPKNGSYMRILLCNNAGFEVCQMVMERNL